VRRGVFLKLFALFLLVIAAATLTFNLTIGRAWKKSLQLEIQRALIEKTRLLAQELPQLPSPEGANLQQLAKQAALAGGVRVTIIDGHGQVLADSGADANSMENHSARPEFAAAMHGQTGVATRSSGTLGTPFLYAAVPVSGGAVRMAYPLSAVQQAEGRVRRSMWIGTAIGLLAALIVAAFLAQLVSRRLRRIVAFAERIATGDLSARIHQRSTDEIAVVATALDRTARKLEESFAAVETSRRQLESLLNSMQEAVIAVDSEGKVLWVNGRMKRLVSTGGRVGGPVVEAVRDPSFLSALEGALRRKERCSARATALLPGRVFQVTAAPMPLYPNGAQPGSAAAGSLPGAVAVLHDLTDVERVEKTRRDFIANVSHELRTPLTSVRGYAETLLDSPAAEETNTRESLDIILKNTARMTRLTDDLLVLARVESGEQQFARRRTDPADLLQDAFETFDTVAREQGLELVLEDTTHDPVLADPEAIHQVFANLIVNAIAYAREGGKIVLGASSRDELVEFYVRDYGPGIASEHLPRLFERFYRVDKARSRESGGTGLGLAIVKHIVRAHEGQVRAESYLGRGSIFYFTIPVAFVPGEREQQDRPTILGQG
jgi:two-component system phosphate regulon sensor histidine kinase PhoR